VLMVLLAGSVPVMAVNYVMPNNGPYIGGNFVVVTNLIGAYGNGTDITNVLVGTSRVTNFVGQGTAWVSFMAPTTSVEGVKHIIVQSASVGATTLTNAYTYNAEGLIGPPSGWSKLSAGINNSVYSLSGNGDALYASGYFQTAGGVSATNVAVWNGSTWSNLPGVGSGQVNAILQRDDKVYIGGDFTSVAGNTSMVSIAMWDGAAWTNLGIGMGGMNKAVRGLAHDGTNLYAVGSFTNAGEVAASRVAKWDGNAWTNLGTGLTSSMFSPAAQGLCALTVGTNLYVGGTFEYAGGGNAGRIARWNGTAWVTMANGVWHFNGATVNALAHDGTNLYVGGFFSHAGGSAGFTNVVKWNGSAWSAMGQGLNNTVQALGIADGSLYAGGQFTRSGTATNMYISRWTGSTWTNVLSGVGGAVRAITTEGQTVYVGGDFTTAGGNSANRMARWTPPESVDSGVAPTNGSWEGGYQVVISGSNLGNGSDITNVTICGGSVTSMVSQSATQVVVMAGAMSVAGRGDVRVYSSSYGMTAKPNVFYAEAPVLEVKGSDGATITNGAAPLLSNGTFFQPLAIGTTGTVTLVVTNTGEQALAFNGHGVSDSRFLIGAVPSTLVAPGGWTNITIRYAPTSLGDVTADLVFTNFAPVGVYTVKLAGAGCAVSTNSGPYSGGNTLTLTNGVIGSGTDITNVLVGGVAATIVAQGETWVTFVVPAATNAGSASIIVQSASLGQRVVNGIYEYRTLPKIEKFEWKWAWWPLGSGVNGKVMALHTIDGTNLFVGGDFTQAGNNTNANYIARYNMESGVWTNLRGGATAPVMALSSYSSSLYVGGAFDGVDGVYNSHFTRWTGSSWQPLRDGVNGDVHALHTIGSDIYVGGNFAYADEYTPSVTKFNGATFPFITNPNMDGATYALAGNAYSNLFAGGIFVRMGENGDYARRVAHYNGGVWSSLGVGLGGDDFGQTAVEALAYDGINLYAGGDFINSGSSNIYYLAKWNGSAWSQVGGGMGGVVKSLVYTNGNLYVGGRFNRAGTNFFPYVAMWNGSVWTNFGEGPNGEVNKLLVLGTNIYAGGEFSEADGMPANNIAKWAYGAFETPGVEPREGSCTGGYQVVIIGTNMMDAADAVPAVTLCGVPVASVVSYSPTQIVVVAAATTRGLLGDVQVTSATYGESVRSNAFTYLGANVDLYGKFNEQITNSAAPSRDTGTDFMHRPLYSTNSQTFWIENSGTETLNISGVSISDPRYQVMNMPTSLVAGVGANFSVTFTPTTIGAFPASLVITNDSAAGLFTVNLYGASAVLSTNVGPYTGGGSVTISNGLFGSGSDITNVTIGGVSAQITAQGANWVTITLPGGVQPGLRDVFIGSSSQGNSTIVGAYRYNAPGGIENMLPGPYVWTNVGDGLGGVWDSVSALAHDGTNLYAA
ncbi:MAG TPA: hypothetical protein DCS43_03265, partial [Verrucomicrobia bacterium]|nr:hypothetical protein [Verrucomicrobiota bacterium]